jgi:hypothetical protein
LCKPAAGGMVEGMLPTKQILAPDAPTKLTVPVATATVAFTGGRSACADISSAFKADLAPR